jgi:micrococcal nuclease
MARRRRRSRPSVSGILRRRARTRAGVAITVILLAIAAVLDHFNLLRHGGDDWKRFDQQSAQVTSVVDGDTIRVRLGTELEETPVRLIGVDAPEMNFGQSRSPDYWAERATRYLEARCEGKQITLRLDQTETRDRYDRLLAYAYLSPGENLNESLVRDGQAYADRRFKHALRPQFEMTESQARGKRTGLWKELKATQMPAWRQRWLEEQSKKNAKTP